MKHDEQNSTRRASSPLALVLLTSFGAGVAGGLVAHWMDGEPSGGGEVRESAADTPGAAQIASEIRALSEAITTLANRPTHQPAPGSPSGTPEPLRTDTTEALDSAVARLAESVTRLSSQSPSAVDRSEITLPVDARAARGRVEALYAQEIGVVKKDHYFLSVRDVVERYGLPDELSADGERLILTYHGSDGSTYQSFWTHQGIVTGYQRQ